MMGVMGIMGWMHGGRDGELEKEIKEISSPEIFCIHDYLSRLLSFVYVVPKLDIDNPRNQAGSCSNPTLWQT